VNFQAGFARRNSMAYRRALVLLALAGAAAAPTVQAALKYQVQDLGLLPGVTSYNRISGASINDQGWIVGTAEPGGGAETGFLYRDGQIRPLGPAGQLRVDYAAALNDRGQIVGQLRDNNTGANTPFLYGDGRFTDLGASLGPDLHGVARGLNNAGQATGTVDRHDAGFANPSAFYWDGSRSRYIDIEGAFYSIGYGINDHGVVAGTAGFHAGGGDIYSAFLYDGARVSLLPPVSAAQSSATVVGIDNAGRVALNVDLAGSAGAFFYADGRYTELGHLGGTTGHSVILGMNEGGWLVGFASITGPGPDRVAAFLYRDGRMSDLNSLLTRDSAQRWELFEAGDVNDHGQITGYGRLQGVPGLRAFIATPVPEPGTAALMLAGLALVVGRVTRRRAPPA
jgi:probable HAF family extracellular repeat protein